MERKLFFLIMFIGLSLTAQEIDTTVTNELNVVEINGVRAPKLTPITQKTLSREEIQLNFSGEEASQVLDKTPAIISHTDGGHPMGYTYIRMRGIDQTRLNMTLNGVPLNEPEDQGVYFSNYPNFMDNIETVQIQRGVGTSSNGVSSYAGSINFISPNGWDKEKNIEINMGSFETRRVSGTFSSGLNKNNLSLYANASAYATDGYRYQSGGNGQSAFISGGYFGDKDILKVTGFFGNSVNEMAWLAVSETDIALDPRTNYNTTEQRDNFTQGMLQLNYIKKISPFHTLNTTAYYNKLKGNYDYFGNGVDEPLRLDSDFMGLITNFNYTNNNIKFDTGLSGNIYERDHELSPYHYNEGNKKELSIYTKVNYQLGNLIFYGDIQYRKTSFAYEGDVELATQYWDFMNPRVGLTYKVSPQFNLYGYVGKSHREPNRTDMFGGNDNLYEFIELEPEEVVDYEGGLNYHTNKFKLQTNFYRMDFKNELSLTGEIGPNSLPLTGSFEESYRMGVELDLSYEPIKNVVVHYNESRSKNRMKFGGVSIEPLYTPDVIRNIVLGYNNGTFNANIVYKHHSESFIDIANENTTPQFSTFDLNMGYDFTIFYMGLNIINLTSEEYYTNGYHIEGENYFYVNAPINAYATLRFKL